MRALVSCSHSRRPRSVAPRVEVSPVRTRRKQRNEWGTRFTSTRPYDPNRQPNSSPPAILEDVDARLAANFAPMLEPPRSAVNIGVNIGENDGQRRARARSSSRACRAAHYRNVEDEIVVVVVVVVVVTAAHGETREKQRSTTTAHDTTATRHTAQLTRDTRQRERHSPLFTRPSPTLRRLCRHHRRRRYFSRSVCVLDEGGDLLDPFRSSQYTISSRECVSGCNSRRDGPVSARESYGTLGSRVEFLWSFLRNDEILAKRVMRSA